MSINREAAYLALEQRLRAAQGVETVERTLRHIDNVQPEEMPYIGMVCLTQTRTSGTGHLPGKYLLPCSLYLYVARKETGEHAQTLLNNLLDAIDRALEAPHNNPAETLSGTAHVQHMRVEGTIELDAAPLGEMAMAVVPVVIVAAG